MSCSTKYKKSKRKNKKKGIYTKAKYLCKSNFFKWNIKKHNAKTIINKETKNEKIFNISSVDKVFNGLCFSQVYNYNKKIENPFLYCISYKKGRCYCTCPYFKQGPHFKEIMGRDNRGGEYKEIVLKENYICKHIAAADLTSKFNNVLDFNLCDEENNNNMLYLNSCCKSGYIYYVKKNKYKKNLDTNYNECINDSDYTYNEIIEEELLFNENNINNF